MWGLGVVQEIDAAAMSIWLKYRNFSPEIEGGGFLTTLACGGSAAGGLQGCGLEDFKEFSLGALINF
jgi:hypothetical protein